MALMGEEGGEKKGGREETGGEIGMVNGERGSRLSIKWVGPLQSQLFWSQDSQPTSQVRPRLKGMEHGAPTPSSQNPMARRVSSQSACVKIYTSLN